MARSAIALLPRRGAEDAPLSDYAYQAHEILEERWQNVHLWIAIAHLGTLHGQLAERGYSTSSAGGLVLEIARAWAEGRDHVRIDGALGDREVLDVTEHQVGGTHLVDIIAPDVGGMYDLGVQYGQRRELGQTVPQAQYETGAWAVQWYDELEGVNPWPPPPRPSHRDPLPGQAGVIHDGAFVCASGPRNHCSLHAGNLIGHGLHHGLASVETYFDLAADAGHHEIRSWFQLKTIPGRSPFWDRWSTPRWNPADDPDLFLAILASWARRGGKWHVAGGGIKDMSNGEEDAAFGTLNWAIRQIGPEAFSTVEACNEIRDTGDEDDIDPKELLRLIRIAIADFTQVPWALSAYTGTEDRDILRTYTPAEMRFYLVHGFRGGHLWDKLRHLYSLAGEGVPVRRNMRWSEGFGPGNLVSITDYKHELTARTMAMAAAQCAIARGAFTFMSGPGVVLESEDLRTMPGLYECPAILRALWPDLARFPILGHSGDRFRGQRIHAAIPEWREDYAIDPATGRYAACAYGPPDKGSPDEMPRERPTVDDVVLVDDPMGRVTMGRLAA